MTTGEVEGASGEPGAGRGEVKSPVALKTRLISWMVGTVLATATLTGGLRFLG